MLRNNDPTTAFTRPAAHSQGLTTRLPPTNGNAIAAVGFTMAAVLGVLLLVNLYGYLNASSSSAQFTRDHPFDPAGYVAWAAATDESVDATKRRAGLTSALLLAPTDPAILDLLANAELDDGNPLEALSTWANLAKDSPAHLQHVFSAFDRLSEHPAWTEFLVQARTADLWAVIAKYANHSCMHNARTAARSARLLALYAPHVPIDLPTLQCIERRLIADGQSDLAYSYRLVFTPGLPKQVGYVFNGDFELNPSGSAFDWALGKGGEYRDGFVAALRANPDEDGATRVLSVRFTSRPIRGPIAEQTLALPGGHFILQYRMRVAGFSDSQPPKWVIRCADSPTSILPPAPRTTYQSGVWSRLEYSFTVPAACRGQTLRLEPATKLSALEGLQGTVVFDDVAVIRRD